MRRNSNWTLIIPHDAPNFLALARTLDVGIRPVSERCAKYKDPFLAEIAASWKCKKSVYINTYKQLASKMCEFCECLVAGQIKGGTDAEDIR